MTLLLVIIITVPLIRSTWVFLFVDRLFYPDAPFHVVNRSCRSLDCPPIMSCFLRLESCQSPPSRRYYSASFFPSSTGSSHPSMLLCPLPCGPVVLTLATSIHSFHPVRHPLSLCFSCVPVSLSLSSSSSLLPLLLLNYFPAPPSRFCTCFISFSYHRYLLFFFFSLVLVTAFPSLAYFFFLLGAFLFHRFHVSLFFF